MPYKEATLASCVQSHPRFHEVKELVKSIVLTSGNCTPSQFRSKNSQLAKLYKADSLQNAIYRLKNIFKKEFQSQGVTLPDPVSFHHNKSPKASQKSKTGKK